MTLVALALSVLAGPFQALPLRAQEAAILSYQDIFHPVFAPNGMVASQEAEATRVGVEVLRRGGNAVDAAAAVGFALAVTLPRAGNLGGGGFMMIHNAETGETVALDYREKAPKGATRDMYLNADGEVDKARSRFSHLSVGVPGTVAGLALAVESYGSLPLAEVIAPAISLAEEGILVSRDLAESLENRRVRLTRWPASAAAFFKSDGSGYQPGERLKQPDLAWSLRQIAEQGPQAFYGGAIAEKIVAEMTENGGLITAEDLSTYEAVLREPVRGSLPRHRDRLHAAAQLRRRPPGADPQHAGGLSDRLSRPQRRRDDPPDGGVHEAGLRRPQPASGRPGFLEGSRSKA